MSHAPGPWRRVQTRVQAGNRASGNAEIVALCGGHEAAEANARLIASAPDLLEAAHAVLLSLMPDGSVGDSTEFKFAIADLKAAHDKALGP